MYREFALIMTIIAAITVIVAILNNNKQKCNELSKMWQFVSNCLDKYWWIVLGLTFIAYLITRIYRLDSVPLGIHVDELSAALDAKCIRDHGTDRFGVRYPFYFINNGGGQNALFTYALSVIIRVFPCTIATMRSFAVFCGAVCLFATFGICYELTDSKKWALIGPILVTIQPVYIMSERWALESYLFLPFATYFMFFAIRAVKYEEIKDFVITGILMGVTLYTYAVSFIVLPIMIILTGIYMIILKRFKWKQVLALAIPLFLLAIPLIIFNLVDLRIISEIHTSIFDIVPLDEQRESELAISNIPQNLLFFKDLFFGGEELTYNVLPEFGTVYSFSIIFLLIGLYYSIREFTDSFKTNQFTPIALIIFFNIGALVFTMIVRGPNINRVNELFLPFTIYIFLGLYKVLKNRPICITIVGTCAAISFISFMCFYIFQMNDVYGIHPLFATGYPMRAVPFCQENYVHDDGKIYVMIEDEAFYKSAMMYYVAGKSDEVYDHDRLWYDNVCWAFPEEFDENENAVYIIGENWNHITGYLISIGFNQDYRYPGYTILYR